MHSLSHHLYVLSVMAVKKAVVLVKCIHKTKSMH